MTGIESRGERLIGIVRSWADIYEQICTDSQERPITAADFDPIAALVADDFTRIGIYKDEQAQDVANVLILGTDGK